MAAKQKSRWSKILSLIAATIMAVYAIRIQYWMHGRELGLGAPGLHLLSGALALMAVSIFALMLRDWINQRALRKRD